MNIIADLVVVPSMWKALDHNSPSGSFRLKDVAAVTHWYTKDGEFYPPKVVANDKVWVLRNFDDYRAACLKMGLPEPDQTAELDPSYCSQWKQFGGIAIKAQPHNEYVQRPA